MSPARSGAHSLEQLSTAAWITALVALVAGTAIIWVGFTQLLDARTRAFDRLQPALVSTQELRTSLVDQETGIRGYAITRDDRLLDPYRFGQRDQVAAERSILADFDADAFRPEVVTGLAKVDAAMASWRKDVADPLLESGVDRADVDAVFLRSQSSFDAVRHRLDDLERALIAEQADARAELDRTTTRLVISIGAAIGLFALVSLAGSWILRRRVVDPVEELVTAADAVATDRLDQPIEVTGPAEIEHLAQRVSEMRDRIVGELAAVEAARVELDRRAADLARSNADLEQFAYVASHDLQEPLRKVASFCQLLEQRYGDQLDERGHSYIEFAVDGAKRMQALIADLLEFSRLGRSTRSFVPCDLDAIAHGAIDAWADQLEGATIDVQPLPTVRGDATLYGALFQNLIGNSVKYRTEGSAPTIRLSAERDGDHWTFACSDEGIGIEPRYRERVFAIFQRLHGRDEFDGTGIGLALCRKIVEFSGGRIWIDDPVGGTGTTVRWTLPLEAPDPAPLPSPPPTSGT
ncbi:sensor histidine kinase [Aquihabitans sp. McL0605]|uniref:sensor histidine kinase n=1 Tax=Aquihabitans sp. McL0605 TaxID=3415671 RepID=UPI003CEEA136